MVHSSQLKVSGIPRCAACQDINMQCNPPKSMQWRSDSHLATTGQEFQNGFVLILKRIWLKFVSALNTDINMRPTKRQWRADSHLPPQDETSPLPPRTPLPCPTTASMSPDMAKFSSPVSLSYHQGKRFAISHSWLTLFDIFHWYYFHHSSVNDSVGPREANAMYIK